MTEAAVNKEIHPDMVVTLGLRGTSIKCLLTPTNPYLPLCIKATAAVSVH